MTIRLYDYSALTVEETARSARVTEQAIGHAGIQVTWMYCRGALATSEPSACQADLRGNEIVVRLIGIEPNAQQSSKSELGYAIAGPEGGQYSAVYVPAVRARAVEWQLAFDLVLGYAMAHEAGHCLLGPKHASAGLMNATWTRKHAREMAQLGLGLSKPESRKALARLMRVEHASANETAQLMQARQ
ncbi:MAG TPA: hypothetical protein VE621_24330 [Bryobacteraceae bacterium]|nr:hypothetical protein [Bryobacteraceae bacterium]